MSEDCSTTPPMQNAEQQHEHQQHKSRYCARLVITGLAAAVLGATDARAQSVSPEPTVRGYVAVSVGGILPTSALVMRADEPYFDWIDGINIKYANAARFSVDLAAGVVIHRRIVAGLSYTFSSAQATAQVTPEGRYPDWDPLPWRSYPLTRSERAIHLSAGLQFEHRNFDWSVFGGPSHLTASQEMITRWDWYTESLGYRPVVQSPQTRAGWGFHVGAEAKYFISKSVGIGATVRYSRATLTFPNYAEQIEAGSLVSVAMSAVAHPAGGVEVLGGLRWRF